MDAHARADGAQPAAAAGSELEGREPGSGGCGERGCDEGAGGGEESRGRGEAEGGGEGEGGGGGESKVGGWDYEGARDKREGEGIEGECVRIGIWTAAGIGPWADGVAEGIGYWEGRCVEHKRQGSWCEVNGLRGDVTNAILSTMVQLPLCVRSVQRRSKDGVMGLGDTASLPTAELVNGHLKPRLLAKYFLWLIFQGSEYC